jgi:hypothetical protein
MRGGMVDPQPSTTASFGNGAWLTAALREHERRARSWRHSALAALADEASARPRIDRAACDDWLAAAPARDRHDTGR